MRTQAIRTAVAAAAALTCSLSNATVINIVDLGGVTGSAAEQSFKIAAKYWENMFTNNATINLGIGFSVLSNPNVIGQTGSRRADFTVANWENRVNATKSSSAIDQAVVLPTLTTGGISGLTAGVNGTGNNDNTVTATLNGTQTASRVLYANTSVIKALGGAVASPGQLDGTVTFNSSFSFDYNPLDGISAGKMDFLGVAIHEIGHALGFVSGVDFFDIYGYPNGPGKGQLGYDLNDTSIFSALDMFRYSAPGTLDFRTGGTKYFSIDGGQTALFGNTMSTGTYHGDGRQASHFKDTQGCGNPQLGIMDPTFCFGQMGEVTGLDLAAYDAMGWNLKLDALTYAGATSADIFASFVPEPASWALLLTAMGAMGAVRRRRATAEAGSPA
ncbi:MAG: PEP-CTERM sorting domain-containing protein [Burkholderiales bacterium]|nr:PEP-CTERM sorting domain-containing protein [Burkholderiales bacterium]